MTWALECELSLLNRLRTALTTFVQTSFQKTTITMDISVSFIPCQPTIEEADLFRSL